MTTFAEQALMTLGAIAALFILALALTVIVQAIILHGIRND